MSASEIFLLDANSLITPHSTYYSFEFARGFWDQIQQHIESGSIAVLDMVRDEIERGTDSLSDWMKDLSIPKLIDHREQAILEKYSEILQYIQANDCYRPSALQEWSRNTVADAWIISAGSVYGHTVITFETHNAGLNSRNPSRQAKIPDVGDVFGVQVKDLYYMMHKLNIHL